MATPSRKQIVEKAVEMWKTDRAKAGDPSFNLNPELSELAEAGYIQSAKSELMYSLENKHERYIDCDVENFAKFSFDSTEIMNTTGFVSGSRNSGKSDVCMYIADRLMNEGITVIAFDPSTDWIQRSSIPEYMTVKPYDDLPIPESNVIFDLSRLVPLDQQKIVENFARKLFDYQVVSKAAKKFFLVLEESQTYAPLNALRFKKTQNFMRLVTVGRNLNTSLCAVSQFPATVDKELIKNSGQIWIGYTAEKNSLDYWAGILGLYTDKLKELSSGQFVYYNRNSISLTEIEPFEKTTTKTAIPTLQPKPIETLPKPKPQTDSYALAKFLVVCGIGLLILLLGVH